jgi:RNA polymerase sigma factor (sigma-70 family)
VGDDEFKELYVRMSAQIFSFAAHRLSPEQAKDVINSTFEVVWHKRDAVPAEPGEWPAWIFGIAKNQILQELQRVRRKHHDNRFIAEYSAQWNDSDGSDIADAVTRTDEGRRVWAQLTHAERNLLNVAFMRDLDNDQASALLGISVTAYTTRVSRLRQRITSLHSLGSELTPRVPRGDHI